MITMPQPNTAHQQHTITTHGNTNRVVYTTEIETSFPDGRLITSRTDLNGIITHANEAFILMSGWERDEIIGQPHHILRHPDMPKVAFADLWETVQRGEKWNGYVKNLRKDGGFYWVYATVIPNVRNGKIEGYTSVRRKPSRDKIKEMQNLYQELLKSE